MWCTQSTPEGLRIESSDWQNQEPKPSNSDAHPLSVTVLKCPLQPVLCLHLFWTRSDPGLSWPYNHSNLEISKPAILQTVPKLFYFSLGCPLWLNLDYIFGRLLTKEGALLPSPQLIRHCRTLICPSTVSVIWTVWYWPGFSPTLRNFPLASLYGVWGNALRLGR